MTDAGFTKNSYIPTTELRFLVLGKNPLVKVLQQKFRRPDTEIDEWRNVPIVEDRALEDDDSADDDPPDEILPLYTRPQAAQDAKDASNPLKGWIFDKVDMGRGDERYICTPDGANATTVRNESTTDHRERMLWLIADAMTKESGR